ncbi:MAG TPA: hypothetical protein VHG69_02750 [Thermoleophilaceae bacterium]|nr:hypothetical protein [Thermoleophilaceae bacterium]
MPWRLPESREARRTSIALVALLAMGALLRLLMMLAWQPAFMGWPDAASYIAVSQNELFGNELRPAGYPIVLWVLHEIWPSLTLVVIVHHLLGLATAAILFFTVARTGAPRALGLIPAGVVALGGDGIFLEHAPISEPLFIFLMAAAMYATVRAVGDGGARWALLGGLLLALAGTVRVVALPLLPVYPLVLLAARGVTWRRRAAVAGACVAGIVLVLGPYLAIEHATTGKVGLSRNGVWNMYGRVAPFADCSKFTAPPGTQPLCEAVPRASRPLTAQYTFNWWYSPAIRNYGDPHSATPAQTAVVASFVWAVIWGQPLDYAEEVGAGLLRYIAPDSFRGYGGGPSYHDLVREPVLFHAAFSAHGRSAAAEHYGDDRPFSSREGLLEALRAEESVTRIQGPVFVLLALLSLAAPFVTRGPMRRSAVLFALTAWFLLVLPVATVEFSARTAVPGFAPLAAAAALGGFGLSRKVRSRLAQRSGAGAGRVPGSRLGSRTAVSPRWMRRSRPEG